VACSLLLVGKSGWEAASGTRQSFPTSDGTFRRSIGGVRNPRRVVSLFGHAPTRQASFLLCRQADTLSPASGCAWQLDELL